MSATEVETVESSSVVKECATAGTVGAAAEFGAVADGDGKANEQVKSSTSENCVVTESASKLDELTSLEREIAEMHHAREDFDSSTLNRECNANASHVGIDELHGAQITCEGQAKKHSITEAAFNGESTTAASNTTVDDKHVIEHEEDLIAVLKGIENGDEVEDTKETVTQAAETKDVELKGSTLKLPKKKGEPQRPAADSTGKTDKSSASPRCSSETEANGQCTSETEIELDEVTIEGEGQFQVMEVVDDENEEETVASPQGSPKTATRIGSPAKTYSSKVVSLTPEEVRAVAMEQMAGLRSHIERSRRRKQDIKQTTLTPNELDEKKLTITDEPPMDISIKDPSSGKSTSVTIHFEDTEDKVGDVKKVQQGKKPKSTAAPSKTTVVTASPKPSVAAEDENSSVSSAAQSGFKRARIIKRKIIWDPDAPETQISYAQLVRSRAGRDESPPKGTPSTSRARTAAATDISLPNVTVRKVRVSAATKEKADTVGSAGTQVETVAGNVRVISSTKSTVAPSIAASNQSTKVPVTEGAAGGGKDASQKRPSTAVTPSMVGKKKKISEIDRLMGDEGAINMLISLETERKKGLEEDGDKPNKPLMRSRSAASVEKIVKSTAASTAATAKKESPPTVKVRRSLKPKASAAWDYVYQRQVNDDSMIIRRRSNSSYSSTNSQRRLSIDTPNTSKKSTTKASNNATAIATASGIGTATASATKEVAKTVATNSTATPTATASTSAKKTVARGGVKAQSTPSSAQQKTFEFVRPESKSQEKKSQVGGAAGGTVVSRVVKVTTPAGGKRVARYVATAGTAATAASSIDEKEKTTGKTNHKDEFSKSDVIMRRIFSVVQISFTTKRARIPFAFTISLLKELIAALEELEEDPECHAVVIVTNSPSFCHGIDLSELVEGTAEERKEIAEELAETVGDYFRALVKFTKPIVAGVNGHNIGLGVTQLPLFDIVIASERSTFETPYAKMGYTPEGHCIWNLLNKTRGSLKTKLFWLGEKINANEAVLTGLATKLTTPNKVNEDALNTALKLAAMPQRPLLYMKRADHAEQSEMLEKLFVEFNLIKDEWISEHCLEAIKRIVDNGHY